MVHMRPQKTRISFFFNILNQYVASFFASYSRIKKDITDKKPKRFIKKNLSQNKISFNVNKPVFALIRYGSAFFQLLHTKRKKGLLILFVCHLCINFSSDTAHAQSLASLPFMSFSNAPTENTEAYADVTIHSYFGGQNEHHQKILNKGEHCRNYCQQKGMQWSGQVEKIEQNEKGLALFFHEECTCVPLSERQ